MGASMSLVTSINKIRERLTQADKLAIDCQACVCNVIIEINLIEMLRICMRHLSCILDT